MVELRSTKMASADDMTVFTTVNRALDLKLINPGDRKLSRNDKFIFGIRGKRLALLNHLWARINELLRGCGVSYK
jgi:hypothetical protein